MLAKKKNGEVNVMKRLIETDIWKMSLKKGDLLGLDNICILF